MDKVSLALFGKINKMFVEDHLDTFIAFNQAAIPYEPDTFQKEIHNEANMPLKAATFREVTGRDNYIWNSYRETLDHAETASSTWNEDKWLEYERQSTELAAMEENYNKHKKEYRDLIAERKGEQTALNELTNQSEKEEKQERIQELNHLINQKLAEWKTRGKKLQYEAALNKILGSEPEYPIQVIQKYKGDLEAAEISGDAASGQIVYSTSFSPFDFFEENGSGWINFELDKEEVNNMYHYALNTVFANQKDVIQPNANDDKLEIERISGELGALLINRNWLNSNFFHAGYWRLAPGFESEILCDGDLQNPKGRLPAYVEKILFIKKLDIELTPNSKVNKETIEKNQKKGTPILFGNMLLKFPVNIGVHQIKNISKPTKINPQIASQYRVAAFNNRQFNIQQLYTSVNISNFKSSINFFNTNKFSILKNAVIPSKPVVNTQVIRSNNNMNTFIGSKATLTYVGTPATSFNPVNSKVTVNLNHVPFTQFADKEVRVKYGFEGVIKAEDGTKLKNIKLVFTDTIDTKKEYVITTNQEGYYKAILPPSPYKLEIDQDGFFRYAKKLSYKKGQKLVIKKHNLTLHKDVESQIEDQFSFVCLGVLCRRVPKSPNPDPNLQWG